MQKVSYMGDGSTTDFYFNFPFYTNTDIIVLKNNQTATDYTVVGTPAGLNADIPYTGGKIVFNHAPFATDSITIYRHLPLSRTVDYQPTEKINPTILNQDMNYMMEILKDMQDKMDVFSEQYTDIVNKESTDNLLSKIYYINQLIDNDEIINKYISNCITKIPQDIKLSIDLNNNIIVNAGSKVYYGDGTYDVLSSDAVYGASTGFPNADFFFCIKKSDKSIVQTPKSGAISCATNPETAYIIWFNTTDAKCYWNNGSGVAFEVSFPVGIAEHTNGTGWTNIKQTFNGFGFVGSTIFALPGAKGLIPNGRNIDGTLKTTMFVCSSVVTKTFTDTAISDVVFQGTTFDQGSYNLGFDNYLYNNSNVKVASTVIGTLNRTNGKITTFNTKQPYQALDYNDSSYIAHQAMPSNRYIDLTLGVSGTTYTAPADGYFTVNKSATASGEYINMINNTNNTTVNSVATGTINCRLMLPVSKNDTVTVNYTVAGTTNCFRFVYANGAK